ncbi:MAG: hypothetical protein LBC83_06940 [Oscillospiraceae bacterium]|jgi:hypothetical protein|nr:hypothetical protein [Oscillospiraceae bacterium]
MRTKRYTRILTLGLAAALLLAGCKSAAGGESTGTPTPSPSERAALELDAVQKLVRQNNVSAEVNLDLVNMQKQEEQTFLFENSCFSILRDHATLSFLEGNVQRPDSIAAIFSAYGSTPVRTMGNYLYTVYETDQKTRVFLFFYRSDSYRYLGGHVVLQKEAHMQSDFATIQKGSTMEDVAQIDPVALLYKQAYDATEAPWLLGQGGDGPRIFTTHIVRDGILRYRYQIEEGSKPRRYVVTQIEYSKSFLLKENDGETCYAILQQDFLP